MILLPAYPIRAKVMVAAAAGEKKPAWPAFNAAVASGA